MSVGRSVQLGALLALLLWTTPVLAAEVDGPCGRERADWGQAYQRFKAGVEHYRQIKDEPITPLIEKMIAEKGRGTSTAALVRSVLEDRKLRMADARARRALGRGEASIRPTPGMRFALTKTIQPRVPVQLGRASTGKLDGRTPRLADGRGLRAIQA
ncbi:MAG: hypothetical protein P8182_07815 [Deltaproteobacteria bacterium]